MTDLHCHILPGIDDGAKTPEISLRLLGMERQQKVRRIVLTPHFNPEDETVEQFCQKRRDGVLALGKALPPDGAGIEFKLGAELYFSPKLLELDLKPLCISGTDILLMELPVSYTPAFIEDILYELQLKGYRLLLAHVDRYPYLLEKPEILYELVSSGIYTHINAPCLLGKPAQCRAVKKLLQSHLVHTIASDTHSPHRRPPRLREAYAQIIQWFGVDYAKAMRKNGDALYAGAEPSYTPQPQTPHHSLFDAISGH